MSAIAVTLDDQITEIDRELLMRHRCYPKWVAERRMAQIDADRQIARLRATRVVLMAIKERKNELPAIFSRLQTL